LRVRHHKQLGWVIQVPAKKAESVPEGYERRQSLASSQRFATARLREMEREALVADSRYYAAREGAFGRLVHQVQERIAGVVALAGALGDLDATLSLAETALDRDWSRPRLVAEPILVCSGLRHPVVEAALPVGEYVPNPMRLDKSRRLGLVTGPNMAGKSTAIRSAAICVLLAQAGSFVPAESAEVGIADAIFARIGSSDAIAEGQSGFLVEMSQTAAILHAATRHSVVILDEIGRGTATHDGMAIAWAVAEHLAQVGCRTLFATHYHELCDMDVDGIHNLRLEVAFAGRDLVFLHALTDGRADRSYGVEVARMAGFPPLVLRRAREVLAGLGEQPGPEAPDEAQDVGQQGLFG
ncbi:DNA mismatch repair protein MutS, partial [bacterium]|nr:DNA mismatch repair protein MutS [bacterium]